MNKPKGKSSPKSDSAANKVVAQNRKARYEYFIEETFETGIVLLGTEVKSLRTGKASIVESYADVEDGALVLINAHIPEYSKSSAYFNHESRRPRKLLMHKSELKKLIGKVEMKGYTLVPLSLYFNARNIAKVELALAKGKKQHDKREAEKDRDWKREQSRILKGE